MTETPRPGVDPDEADPTPSTEPSSRRTGIDKLRAARAALAAARAEARRRGLRPGAVLDPARSGAPGSGPGRRRWSAGADERSGAHPDERDPQRLGATLDRLIAERGWETDAAVGGVMGRWAAIVGAEVAAHAQPRSFDDGLLVVETDSTAWATQIRLLAPTLLARLAAELGAGVVRSVTVRGPVAPSWTRGRWNVPGRGPRDTYG